MVLRARRALVPAAAGLAIACAGAPARAQSADNKTAAEALFDEAKTLAAAKRFGDACPKFEASQRLDPGIGTLLYLADCYEQEGRAASAWATFREAESEAKAAGQGDRERVADGRARRLEPKLYKLTLAVGGAATPGLKVLRNDAEVRREVWSTAVPVDAGPYTVTVSAPGKKTWSIRIQIPPGAGAQTVDVPPLEDDPNAVAPPPPPPPPKNAEPPAPPPPPPPPPPAGLGTQRVAGIAVGAVGVVGLGLGATFGGLAISANNEAKSVCPSVACRDQGAVDASHRAGTFADAATGLLIAGGVLAATGLVVFLTAPARRADRAWVAPVVGAGVVGLGAGRTW